MNRDPVLYELLADWQEVADRWDAELDDVTIADR